MADVDNSYLYIAKKVVILQNQKKQNKSRITPNRIGKADKDYLYPIQHKKYSTMKTLDETIVELFKECSEPYLAPDEKKQTDEELLAITKKTDLIGGFIPKEEYPLMARVWKRYSIILPPNRILIDYIKDVYKLFNDVTLGPSYERMRVFRRNWDKSNNNSLGAIYKEYLCGSVYALLLFRSLGGAKYGETLDAWIKVWGDIINREYIENVTYKHHEQCVLWRKKEAGDCSYFGDALMTTVIEYESRLSKFSDDSKQILQQEKDLVEGVKKAITDLNGRLAELEADNAAKDRRIKDLEKEQREHDSEANKKKIGEEYVVKIVEKELEDADDMEDAAKSDKYKEMAIFLEMDGVPKKAKDLIKALRKKKSNKQDGKAPITIIGNVENYNDSHSEVHSSTLDSKTKLLGE